MPRRGWVFIMAFIAATAACGGAAPPTKPTGAIIVDLTRQADTARFESTLHITFHFSGDDVGPDHQDATMTGAIDFSRDAMSATIHAAQPDREESTVTPRTTPDSDSSSLDTEISVSPSVGDTEMLSIGHDTYSRFPSDTPSLSDKHWIRFSSDTFGDKCAGAVPSGFAMVAGGAQSSTGMLDELRASGTDLSDVGREEIRGVNTTHWRSPPRTADVCRSTDEPQIDVESSIEVWTDKDDRARRLRLSSTSTTTEQSATTTVKQDVTTEFFDFGVDVSIAAPPASDVFDMSAVMEDMKQGPGKVDASAWRPGAQGSDHGAPWRVDWAPTTTGWRCYDVIGIDSTTDDSFSIESSQKMPTHDGHQVTDCLPAHVFMTGARALLSTSQPSALVAALPGGGDARLEFSDGSSQAVTADADSWLFTWTDPKTPTRITTDDGSCSVEPLGLSFGSEPPPSDAEDFTLPCGPEEATSIRVAQTPAKFCEQFVKPASTTSTTLDVQGVIDSVCANDNR